ncbi:MAG: hypothetical protein HC933_11725 [Pleurocapsa sp. SU_196_0]|nr:hypothetical protein [Pleurocapsa sp. SU_196_0]
MRRMFKLPDEDVATLAALGLAWETLIEVPEPQVTQQWLLIHDYPISGRGYTVSTVNLAFLIDSLYPDTQIDMAYFYPALAKLDGSSINALAEQLIDGKKFQRWSRHRTPQNPWRPGVDEIGTHLLLVNHWLERELGARAA